MYEKPNVHEFAFTLDSTLSPDDYLPAIGLQGERRNGPIALELWTCRLSLATGRLQYDDISDWSAEARRRLESGIACVPAGSTITVRIHFDEQCVGFSVDGSPMKWFGPDLLAYAGAGFQPVSSSAVRRVWCCDWCAVALY